MYLSSYDDVVEQLKGATPTLSDHEVRVQAAQTFRPRYHQDKISEKREAANLPEYEIGHFTLTDNGDVRYIEYGKTLEEMQQSQIRQRPHEYSQEEHQASRMIQEAFRNGATVVSTVYPRKDNNHRDILVMRYDPATHIGTASIINTATEGTYHAFESIHEISRKHFSHLEESKPGKKVFILSDVKVEEQRGSEIVQEVQQIALEVSKMDPVKERGYWRRDSDTLMPQQAVLENTSQSQSVILGVVKEGEETGRRVVKDTIATFSRMVEMVRDRSMNENKKSESQPVFVQVTEDSRRTKKARNDSKQKNSMLVIEQPEESQEEKNLPKQHLEVQERLQGAVQNQMAKVARVRASIISAIETKVGVDAALFGLHTVFKELPKEEIYSRLSFSDRLRTTLSIPKREARSLSRKERKQKTQRECLGIVLLRLARNIHKIEKHSRLPHEAVRKVQGRTSLHVEKPRLTDMAPKEIRRIEKKLRHEKRKEAVLNFSFALTIWLLLQPPEVHPSPPSSKQEERYHVSIYRYMITNVSGTSGRLERKIEALAQKEPILWILLSIIWYLAMIREQGITNMPINKYTNTTNNQMKTKIQSHGVIFVFAPVPEHSSVRGFTVAFTS